MIRLRAAWARPHSEIRCRDKQRPGVCTSRLTQARSASSVAPADKTVKLKFSPVTRLGYRDEEIITVERGAVLVDTTWRAPDPGAPVNCQSLDGVELMVRLDPQAETISRVQHT
eukprot:2139521-Rhodomonas_salina.2